MRPDGAGVFLEGRRDTQVADIGAQRLGMPELSAAILKSQIDVNADIYQAVQNSLADEDFSMGRAARSLNVSELSPAEAEAHRRSATEARVTSLRQEADISLDSMYKEQVLAAVGRIARFGRVRAWLWNVDPSHAQAMLDRFAALNSSKLFEASEPEATNPTST
jgi:hypothetical protein